VVKRTSLARFLGIAGVLGAAILIFCLGLSRAQSSGGHLDLNLPGVQLMDYYYDYSDPAIGHRIYQHIFNGTSYQAAWKSGPLPYQSPDLPGDAKVRIGDIDNDGQREVVASTWYVTLRERVKKALVDHSDFRILVYKAGCLNEGSPLIESPPLGEIDGTIINDSAIGDVDNLGALLGRPHNELVLARTFQVDLWRYDLPAVTETIGHVSGYLYGIDIGDADNDIKNEIVVTSQGAPYPIIFKYENGAWGKILADPVPAQYFGAGSTSLSLFYAKVRDADNDGLKEIIACGTNGRLMVWKYDGSGYRLKFVGDYLGVNTAHAIDAGDIGGGKNEILLNVWGERKFPSRIVRYSYDLASKKYVQIASYVSPLHVYDLVLGNMDGKPGLEVGLNCYTSGLYVYGLSSGNFVQVYTAPSDGTGKIEIK
jgi:hypothetical protein